MRSPFPGMDPYIEARHLFEDFHHDLISEIKASLASRLPERYVVRAGERSYVALALDDDAAEAQQFLPHGSIATSRRSPRESRRTKGPTPASVGQGRAAPVL